MIKIGKNNPVNVVRIGDNFVKRIYQGKDIVFQMDYDKITTDALYIRSNLNNYNPQYKEEYALHSKTVDENFVYQGIIEVPKGDFQFNFLQYDNIIIPRDEDYNPIDKDVIIGQNPYLPVIAYTKSETRKYWKVTNWQGGYMKVTVDPNEGIISFDFISSICTLNVTKGAGVTAITINGTRRTTSSYSLNFSALTEINWSCEYNTTWYEMKETSGSFILDGDKQFNLEATLPPIHIVGTSLGDTNSHVTVGNNKYQLSKNFDIEIPVTSYTNRVIFGKGIVSVTRLEGPIYYINYLFGYNRVYGYDTEGCSNLIDISGLKYLNIDRIPTKSLYGAFIQCTALKDISVLENWKNIKFTSLYLTFSGCTSLSDISPLKDWDTSNVTTMYGAFNSTNVSDLTPLKYWSLNKVTTIHQLFAQTSISDISPIKDWNVNNVSIFSKLFFGCTNLSDISGLNWNFSNATDITQIIAETNVPLKHIENWNITNKCIGIADLRTNNLEYEEVDLTKWDVSGVKNLHYWLPLWKNYVIDISGWDLSNVDNEAQNYEYLNTIFGTSPDYYIEKGYNAPKNTIIARGCNKATLDLLQNAKLPNITIITN